MNDNQVNVEELLASEAAAPSVSPTLLKLDGYRIATDTEVPQEEFLFRMFGTPCFPRRDITAVTGMEKCGKTFFTSMLMACSMQRQILALDRNSEQPLRVLWYDTEQSRQSTKSVLTERVGRLAGSDEGADEHVMAFNVRACTYQERVDYLVEAVTAYHPDLVIIDNISDLLPSINDVEHSIALVDQLLQLATEYDCNITVVIHLNRSGDKRNLRGWLGTEIVHKAFDVFNCAQIEDTNVLMVQQTMTRKRKMGEELYYVIDDSGLPQQTEKPQGRYRDTDGKFKSSKSDVTKMKSDAVESFNQKYILRQSDGSNSWDWDLQTLFNDAMAGCAMTGLDMLKANAMKMAHIQYPQYYEKLFQRAIDTRVIQTTIDRHGRVVVIRAYS